MRFKCQLPLTTENQSVILHRLLVKAVSNPLNAVYGNVLQCVFLHDRLIKFDGNGLSSDFCRFDAVNALNKSFESKHAIATKGSVNVKSNKVHFRVSLLFNLSTVSTKELLLIPTMKWVSKGDHIDVSVSMVTAISSLIPHIFRVKKAGC
jgi:hypothetical protein